MSKKKYQILVPQDNINIVYKDDGKKIVLFFIDQQDENHIQTFNLYKGFIYTQLLDILLCLDYKEKGHVYEDIRKAIIEVYDSGAAEDLSNTLLCNLYVADVQTGKTIFNNIEDPNSIINWKNDKSDKKGFNIHKIHIDKKWIYIVTACIAIGIVVGFSIALIPGWFSKSNDTQMPVLGDTPAIQKATPKPKINAVYDPKTCTIYFSNTKFETIEYYIDYQKKIKDIEDINWQLQSSTINVQDTLFLKDNCTVYLRGEADAEMSEVQVIDVSYLDFITQLLVTGDPLIKSMLVTNSSTLFGNTIFMVDGVPQQASYYKSSELTEYFKNGFRVTSVKMIGSNLNPTNKRYPKLSKIIIQKQ